MAQSGQQVGEMHVHEGNSVAAWVMVAVMAVGALFGAIAVVTKSTPLGMVGGVIVIAGIVVGKVLQVAGYGINSNKGH
jgi:hypothetical protein